MAAIHFINNGDIDHPQRFQFRNQLLGADSLQYLRDAFIYWAGRSKYYRRYGSSPWLRIKRRHRNGAIFFQNQFTDIGWMGDKDSVKRNNKMNLLKEAIAAQPGSFFLPRASLVRKNNTAGKSWLRCWISLTTQSGGQVFSNSSATIFLSGLEGRSLPCHPVKGSRW